MKGTLMARIEKSIEVNAPLRTVYNQWTQFEDFPKFMENVLSVKQLDDTHLHWKAKVGGKEKEWDAVITEQVPDEIISWRSIDGTQTAGTVRFYPAQGGKARITLVMDYDPEGFVENVGDIVGVTSRRVENDLQRFKEFIESSGAETGEWRGEVYQGQTVGRSGAQQAASMGTSGTGAGQMQAEQQYGGQQGGRTAPQGPQSSTMSQGSASRNAGVPSSGGSLERQQGFPRAGIPSLFGGFEDPFTAVRRMAYEMERMFEDALGGGALRSLGRKQSGAGGMWVPAVEIAQRGNNLLVRAEVPGVRKEDLHVEVQNGMLVIQGERREESEQRESGVLRSERRYGQFYRAIQLPEEVDADSAQANIRDGVLEITFSAPQRQQARRLEIRDDQQQQGQSGIH